MEPREWKSTFELEDGDGCRSRIPCTMSTDQSTKIKIKKKKKTYELEWCSWRKVGGDVGGKADGGFVELEDGTKGGDVGGGAEWSSARIWDWEFEKSESENDKWEKWKPKREDEKNQGKFWGWKFKSL